MFARDPVSVMWDRAAARLLARAAAAGGEWVATRITEPTGRQRGRLASMGIDAGGPDNSSAQGGRGGARSRWGRGFVRSMYYNHGGGQALVVEVGRMLPAKGELIPKGRAVRVRVVSGGGPARAAVGQLAAGERIFTPGGAPGPRWSDPDLRDW